MSVRRRGLAACAVLCSGLCALLPAQAQRWTEYTSDNFVVYTDLSEKRARNMIEEFEVFRDAVMMITGINSDGENSQLRVLMFRRKSDFGKLTTNRNVRGFFVDTFVGPRMIMGPGVGWTLDRQLILFHEYVHYLLDEYSSLRYPGWYQEGLAEVFGATEVKSKHITVGAVPEGRILALHAYKPLDVATLINPAGARESNFTSRFYATAWLFAHYVQIRTLSTEPELKAQTADYLSRYDAGEDEVTAFENAFGMSTRDMDRRLRSYARGRSVPAIRLPRPDIEVAIAMRPLTTNEEAFLLGDIAWRTRGDDVSAEFLADMEESEEGAARALSLLAVIRNHEGQVGETDRLVAAALDSAAEDGVVLRNLAHVELDRFSRSEEAGDDGAHHLQRAIELGNRAIAADPDETEAYRYLWQAYAASGESIDAARNMMAAYQRRSTNARLNLEIGSFLVAEGHPQLAMQFLEAVLDRAHDNGYRAEATRLLGELANPAADGVAEAEER